jgi:hypothetical protein
MAPAERFLMIMLKCWQHPLFYLLLILTIFLSALNAAYPMVGWDYVYYVTRLLDSLLYYLNNGLAIQWWSPSFGGGLPAYPNPQQMQFTLPQALMFLMNPWLAINLTLVLFTIIGYYSMFFLLHRKSGFTREQAILGATLFSVNGFYMEHLCAGHIGYITFPLLPFVIVLLLKTRLSRLVAAIGIALTFVYLMHSAGFYVVVIFAFAVPITILLMYLLSDQFKPDFRHIMITALTGSALGMGLSSSKLVAVASFMRYFPRYAADAYHVSVWRALAGLAGQLFFTPVAFFFKQLPINTILRNLTQAPYELWELDIGLSPVIVLMLFSVFLVPGKLIRRISETLSRRKIGWLAMLGVLVWMACELSMARGYLYGYVKQFPFIQSLRVNVRFSAIFILPLTVLALYGYTALTTHLKLERIGRFNVHLLLAVIAIVGYTAYIKIPIRYGCVQYDVSQALADWADIRQSSHTYQIKYIGPVGDARVFRLKTSSITPYEPIFTPPETFAPQTKAGWVNEHDERSFNLTNPASLVFPHENNLAIFQRIARADETNFKQFVTYHATTWKLSTDQRRANFISLGMCLVMMLLLLYAFYGWMTSLLKGKTHQQKCASSSGQDE